MSLQRLSEKANAIYSQVLKWSENRRGLLVWPTEAPTNG